ncbi:MAG: PAS domain S-box protein [Anaerolineae bacterium]|nr:PAS domain S-box protein [Anaerolineae bacterium]
MGNKPFRQIYKPQQRLSWFRFAGIQLLITLAAISVLLFWNERAVSITEWLWYGLVNLVIFAGYMRFQDRPTLKITANKILAMSIGAILYAVLSWTTNVIRLPSISFVSLRLSVVTPIFLGLAYGPMVGFFTGAMGNILGDAIAGWGVYPIWDMANGLMGLVPGLIWLFPEYQKANRKLYFITSGALIIIISTALFFPKIDNVWGGPTPLAWTPILGSILLINVLVYHLAGNKWPRVTAAILWGTLGVISGISFAAIADSLGGERSVWIVFAGEYLPAIGPNLIFAAVLTPFLYAAWQQFNTISNQIRYGLTVFVVTSLLITSRIIIHIASESNLNQIKILQSERAQTAAYQISNEINNMSGFLEELAALDNLMQQPPETQEWLLSWPIEQEQGYERLILLDNQGQVRAKAGADTQQTLLQPKNELFFMAQTEGERCFSPLIVDTVTREPSLSIAIPILNEQETVEGILMADVSLKQLWKLITEIQVGEDGYAYLLDEHHVIIAANSTLPEDMLYKDLSDYDYVAEITETPDTAHVYTGLQGNEVIGTAAFIPCMGWYVVLEYPASVAEAPIQNLLLFMGVAVSLVTIIAVGLGVLITQKILNPLSRLSTAAEQISAGELDTRVELHTNNEFDTLASTFNEMTARLNELLATVESESNFVTTILNTADALVTVTDMEGHLIRFNRASEQLTGYTFEEVQGKSFFDLFVLPEEEVDVDDVFTKLKETQTANRFENYWQTKSGEKRLIAWSNAMMGDSEEAPKYMVSIGVDITEQRKAEELQREKEAAEAANQAKSVFLANMSHELRTPLNAIIGYSEMLQEDAEDMGEDLFSSDLEKIHIAANHLLTVINDILDLSKIEAGKMELYLETSPITPLVHDIVTTVQPLVKKNHNILEVNYPEEAGEIHTDVVKLRQILFNLLSNAAKFTENGKIVLTVTKETHNGQERVKFEVKDTGIGIPEEKQAHIFDAFTQADNSTTRQYGGTGLGLAISQRYCKMMGGELILKSAPGMGSTFTVYLPLISGETFEV